MRGRKRKVLGIAIPMWSRWNLAMEHFFKDGITEIIKSPIPKDAEYRSAHYDHRTDSMVVYFYHPSFRECAEGEMIPIMVGFEIEFTWKKR